MRNNNDTPKQNQFVNFYMSKLKGAVYPTFLILFFMMGIFDLSWGQAGSIGLSVTDCSNSTSTAICQNETVLLSISSCTDAVCDIGNPKYCWYKKIPSGNFEPISGASDAEYQTVAGAFGVAGEYKFKRCYSCGTDPCNDQMSAFCSNEVMVEVNPLPTVSVNSPETCSGVNTNITATASGGTGTLTYVWTVPAGVTNPGNVSSFETSTAGTYSVTVTDTKTCTKTASGVLTVNPNATITTQPVSSTPYCQNTTATALSITANNASSYQWYSNTTNSTTGGTLIPGQTNSNFTPSTMATGTTYYYVVASSINGCSTVSQVAVVSTFAYPLVSSQPISNQYCKDAMATNLLVNATPATEFQWYSNIINNNSGGTPINNATINTYTPPTNNTGTIYYYAIAKNNICSTSSIPATITVASKPTAGDITINGNNPQAICAKNNVFASFGQGSGGFNGSPSYMYKVNNEAYQTYTPGEAINTNAENFELNGGKITFQSIYATGSGVGCNQSDSVKSIIINPLPQPIINITESSSNASNDGKICSGDLVTLMAENSNNNNSPSPYRYFWNNNSEDQTLGNQQLFYNPNAYNYTVTITDKNSCSKKSDTKSITVFDNPISDIEYDNKMRLQLYENQLFDLKGENSFAGLSTNSSITNYSWSNLPTSLNLNGQNTSSQNLLNIKFFAIPAEGIIFEPKLRVTNNYNCFNDKIYNPSITVRADSNCTVEITGFKPDYCLDQFPLQLQTKVITPPGGQILGKNVTTSSGLSISGFTGNSQLNDITINTSKSGQFTFSLIFNGNLTQCGLTTVPFPINIFDEPILDSIKSNLDTICQDINAALELELFVKKQDFQHNKKLRINYQINGKGVLSYNADYSQNSIKLPLIPKDSLIEGNNIIKITGLEIDGINCSTLPNSSIMIEKVLSCTCENLVIGTGFSAQVDGFEEKQYCQSDSLSYFISKIDFDSKVESSLTNPKAKVVFSTDILGANQIYSTEEFDLDANSGNNNVKGKIGLLSPLLPINTVIYVNYFVAPKGDFNTCSVKKSINRQFIIRYSPLPVLNDVVTGLCSNSSLIPISFEGDLNGNPDLPINYDWQSNNVNTPVQNGYLSIAKNILNSEIQITLTQKNKYGSLTCPSDVSRVYTINTSSSAPDRSTIARYPGHVYFLEDTTDNLCVQWGLANDNTFNNNSILTLNSSTNPKVSQSGYAVFGNSNLTGELESLKKYLWADTWYKAGTTCGNVTDAECVTRTYYNASLPPKGAPRSTPDTYQAVIYPNPSTGQFTLALQGDWADTFTIDLLDYTRRQVVQLGRIDKALYKTETTIDIQGVLPGMYLLRVVGTDGLARMHKVTIY